MLVYLEILLFKFFKNIFNYLHLLLVKEIYTYMKCTEPGVLQHSHYYFNTPSGIAKKLYFYCICIGEFFCTTPYHTCRNHYNSFLLMEILEGECLFKQEDKILTGHTGDFILLNCYKPHEYYTNSSLHFRFIHFDGNVSEDFYDLITQGNSSIIHLAMNHPAHTILSQLLSHYSSISSLTEGTASCMLHQLLCILLTHATSSDSYTATDSALKNALSFIHLNYEKDLSVELIAQQANLSIYHFSRLFKKETGYSPYEYLIHYRLDKAKKLLKTSQKTISEVSFLTGFKSESNFIYCFHKNMNMSPGQFRRLPF